MKIAHVIHWKTDHAPGIRGFSGRAYAERRVTRAGNSLDDLHEVNGVFIYWPPERGSFPDKATLAQWEAEYDARPEEKSEVEELKERVAELEAKSR